MMNLDIIRYIREVKTMVWIIIVAVIALILLWVVFTYNGLVKLRNKAKAAWAQIDVQLTRRADLIPNVVETVKGYAKHEEETLEKVIQARNKYVTSSTIDQQMASAGELTQALSRLMVLAESYPELKANQNFMRLQSELSETENKIAYARQFYNDDVAKYKNMVEMFPSSLIASLFNFNALPFFEAEQESKQAPKVSF